MSTEVNNQGCAYGKVNRTKIENLETMFTRFLENDFKELKDNIKSIADKISKPRPSWGMTLAITILSSLSVGLIVTIVKITGG